MHRAPPLLLRQARVHSCAQKHTLGTHSLKSTFAARLLYAQYPPSWGARAVPALLQITHHAMRPGGRGHCARMVAAIKNAPSLRSSCIACACLSRCGRSCNAHPPPSIAVHWLLQFTSYPLPTWVWHHRWPQPQSMCPTSYAASMRLDSLRLWLDCLLPSFHLCAVLSVTLFALCHTLCRRTGSCTALLPIHSYIPADALMPFPPAKPSCALLQIANVHAALRTHIECGTGQCARCNGSTGRPHPACRGSHSWCTCADRRSLPFFLAYSCNVDHISVKAPYHRTATSSDTAPFAVIRTAASCACVQTLLCFPLTCAVQITVPPRHHTKGRLHSAALPCRQGPGPLHLVHVR